MSRSKTVTVAGLQLAWHYDSASEPEWGLRYLPGIRWRRAVVLGRLTAWVGAA